MESKDLRVGNIIKSNVTGLFIPVTAKVIYDIERYGVVTLSSNPPKPIFEFVPLTYQWLNISFRDNQWMCRAWRTNRRTKGNFWNMLTSYKAKCW